MKTMAFTLLTLLAALTLQAQPTTIPDADSYAAAISQLSHRQRTFGLASNTPSPIRPAVFCFYTDIHGDAINTHRIFNFCQQYATHIDDILHGGDNTRGGSNDYTWFAAIPEGRHVLNCIGNHDTDIFDAQGQKTGKEPTKKVYDKFFAPYVSHWNVQQPKDADRLGLSYYTKAYPECNVRLIVLDCMYYDDRQDDWFSATLKAALNKGEHVVVLQHFPIGSTPIDCTFTSYTYLRENAISNDLDPRAVATVDRFIQSGGHFICWLGGHTHKNAVGIMPHHHNQLLILQEPATCDSIQNAWSDTARIPGTRSQDSFSLISFDTYAHTIRLLHIGNEWDQELRHHQALTLDYTTGIVLSNY